MGRYLPDALNLHGLRSTSLSAHWMTMLQRHTPPPWLSTRASWKLHLSMKETTIFRPTEVIFSSPRPMLQAYNQNLITLGSHVMRMQHDAAQGTVTVWCILSVCLQVREVSGYIPTETLVNTVKNHSTKPWDPTIVIPLFPHSVFHPPFCDQRSEGQVSKCRRIAPRSTAPNPSIPQRL